ncbi:MAG: Mrp/NBP35 family ATP-binding protein [Deltaproteobacteria bacterium]|nr:Mrp/NBP35 family ATP-binding protein [Deltaproteobacteria bacterium]
MKLFSKKQKDVTKQDLIDALRFVQNPTTEKDIFESGIVNTTAVCDNIAKIVVSLDPITIKFKNKFKVEIEHQLRKLPLKEFKVEFLDPVPPKPKAPEASAKIKNIIAVASGKGGVGKSTVATNLSLALSKKGFTVGLLDADIYGPSIPLMMQKTGVQPEATQEGEIFPIENYGIKMMSVGFISQPGEAVVWRGPMIHKLLSEFFSKVLWGELDYLVVDLPPGTGDAQLSLSQLIPLTGAVIVTTPQDVALVDVDKSVAMFKKVNVPILGVIENMSTFVCPQCGHEEEIFSHGGGEKAAFQWGNIFLGSLPLKTSIRKSGDAGNPFVLEETSEESKSLFKITENLTKSLVK